MSPVLNTTLNGKVRQEELDKLAPPYDKVDVTMEKVQVEDVEKKSAVMKREHWPHHMDFILSCVGYAVGFGSIWRFPYLCMRNGGGAFLIPYLFFMTVCGVPLFFLELAIGQFAGASPLSLWGIAPLFKGLGWSMLIVSGVVCVYYNIILTWVLYYLFVSFASDVPWRTCGNSWNTCKCFEQKIVNQTVAAVSSFMNETSNAIAENCTIPGNRTSAAEEFWKYNTLDISPGIENVGSIRWALFGCLILAWVLIFACLCKGVKSVGKVVYVTATSPYLFLTILLVRNCMLEGSWLGVKFFLEPDFNRLKDYSIWAEAALQVFFALGPAWGGLITMSSFNKFHNNCYRDAIIVPVINCLTSIFGGFVIFTVIGHMAHVSGVKVEDSLEVGPGIVFVAYPEAIAHLPFSPLWSVLFFLMLITIGLDSQFGMFETMTSSFIDEFPTYLRPYKTAFTAFMCFVEFIIAIPLVTNGGIYIFTIMDWYCATFSLALVALLEIVVICYVYGIHRFRADIKEMIGYEPSHFWTAMWLVVTPLVLLLVFCSSVILYKNPTYGTYEFPTTAIVFGWCLGFSSIVPIPLVAIYKILMEEGPLLQRIRKLLRPAPNWGPHKDVFYVEANEAKSTNKLLNSSVSI